MLHGWVKRCFLSYILSPRPYSPHLFVSIMTTLPRDVDPHHVWCEGTEQVLWICIRPCYDGDAIPLESCKQLHQTCNWPEGNKNMQSASHDNWCTETLLNRVITAQWEGMGDVGSARYEPALLPPYPTIRVLSYSNCQEINPLHF